MAPETLRIPINRAWGDELERFLLDQMAGCAAPERLDSQVHGVFCAGYFRDIGLLRYAKGAPLDEARRALRRSCEFVVAVFRLRERASAAQQPDSTQVPVDDSLTNSCRGLDALELALCCGAIDLAAELAPMVWDPPNARYLGPGSVVCTPQDQHLGYALRDYLMQRPAHALAELRMQSGLAPAQRARAVLLDSLLNGNPAALPSALATLHECHLDRVDAPGEIESVDALVDVPTLAYTALCTRRFADFKPPPPDLFLPLELAQPSVDRDGSTSSPGAGT